MIYKERNKFGNHIRYNIIKWKNKFSVDALNCISDNVTLLQLMDSIVNFDHSMSIVGK